MNGIRVRDLRKTYDGVEAVRGVGFDVAPGEVFCLLGPNGAGKTTTVEILEGYRKRNAGEVSVLGEDPQRAPRAWRERIGIVLQQCRMPPQLTVRETIEQYAGYFRESRPVDETVALVGLEHKADERIARLSGGQQRRLDVAVALIGDPELLFLDEPTTGFDPTARRQAWKVISNLRELGKTVFLTTHYMEEAQYLADRAAIIVAGEVIAEGSPAELGRSTGADTEVRFRLPDGVGATDLPSGFASAQADNGFVTLRTGEPVRALNELTGWALERGIDLSSIEVGRPSLEDIYLELTGRSPEGSE
jgi:ABC-2 type transport system ATP-binding protein